MTDAFTPPTPAEVAANRQAWLAALRSGNYPQGQYRLRSVRGFCCLGVAEDTLDCTWLPDLALGNYFVATHTDRDAGSSTGLTPRGMRLLGLRATWVVVRLPSASDSWQPVTLVNLNDDLGYTLSQIADVIEDQGEDWNGAHTRAGDEAVRRNRAERSSG